MQNKRKTCNWRTQPFSSKNTYVGAKSIEIIIRHYMVLACACHCAKRSDTLTRWILTKSPWPKHYYRCGLQKRKLDRGGGEIVLTQASKRVRDRAGPRSHRQDPHPTCEPQRYAPPAVCVPHWSLTSMSSSRTGRRFYLPSMPGGE